LYTSIQELIEAATKEGKKISQIAKRLEAEELETTEEKLTKAMKEKYDVMKRSVEIGLTQELNSMSGLTGKEGKRFWEYIPKSISGRVIAKAIARAMAVGNVNASMGKIVAAPTAGASGILPSVIITVGEKLNSSEDEIIDALFTAGAIGKVIAIRASLSGAEGGCQAECGSAAAMAAGATVELAGGTPNQVGDAVALALKSIMGLVCDPVAGLVEIPCIKRNGILASVAISAADISLAGIKSVIPPDEVIDAMKSVGEMLPNELKETALGGIAVTPTSKEIEKRLRGLS